MEEKFKEVYTAIGWTWLALIILALLTLLSLTALIYQKTVTDGLQDQINTLTTVLAAHMGAA